MCLCQPLKLYATFSGRYRCNQCGSSRNQPSQLDAGGADGLCATGPAPPSQWVSDGVPARSVLELAATLEAGASSPHRADVHEAVRAGYDSALGVIRTVEGVEIDSIRPVYFNLPPRIPSPAAIFRHRYPDRKAHATLNPGTLMVARDTQWPEAFVLRTLTGLEPALETQAIGAWLTFVYYQEGYYKKVLGRDFARLADLMAVGSAAVDWDQVKEFSNRIVREGIRWSHSLLDGCLRLSYRQMEGDTTLVWVDEKGDRVDDRTVLVVDRVSLPLALALRQQGYEYAAIQPETLISVGGISTTSPSNLISLEEMLSRRPS